MYLPSSAFHDAFKDPTTYPQDLLIECATGFFSALDGDIESSGVEFDEYFCTSEDLSYGECPASTFKASLINRGNLRSVHWDDVWTVYIGYMNDRQYQPIADDVNAEFRWSSNQDYYYAKKSGLYYGSTLIDGSGECYSLYASDSLECLYAFGDGYTYEISQDGGSIQKITPPKYMIDKFRTPQGIYWDADFMGNGYALRYRSVGNYTEEWYYIPMGVFFVEKPKNLSDAVVEIDGALDYMRNFDKEATHLIETMNTAYPNGATVRQWVLATCTEADAPSPIIGDVGADTYTLDPSTANTLRDILANLAECYNGVFRYNKNGEMVVGQIGTQAVEEVEPRRIEESSLSIAELKTSPPDAVVNKNTAGLTYINGQANPDNPYYILGNPFIQDNSIVSLADVQFPSYHPMSLVVLEADPCVDVGDLIDVQISPEQYRVLTDLYDRPYDDGDHSIYILSSQPLRMPLMHRLLHWNGVCTATYECTGNEKRVAPYGAELTDYNANVANDSTNIINKIQAHGIDADWITTGTLSDRNGNYSLDMDTGTVNMANANITGGSINIDTTSTSDDRMILRYGSATGSVYRDFYTNYTSGGFAQHYDRYNISGDTQTLTETTTAGTTATADLFAHYSNASGTNTVNADLSYSSLTFELTNGGVNQGKTVYGKSGVKFYDGSNNIVCEYPSTGLHKLTPQSTSFTDSTAMTGAVINVPFITAAEMGISGNANAATVGSAWLKWICAHYTNKQICIFEGCVQANSYRMVRAYIYNTSAVNSSGYPQYASGTMQFYEGTLMIFGENNYSAYSKTVTAT